jgi:hypothetical protein
MARYLFVQIVELDRLQCQEAQDATVGSADSRSSVMMVEWEDSTEHPSLGRSRWAAI